MSSSALATKKAAFQAALLGWYRKEARRLPWRDEPSLYKTVVSEFMLQQTQVKTVLPYFARWMSELPDFAALAAASPDQVLKLWEGLGYYSRARNLHRLAQEVVGQAAGLAPGEQPGLQGAATARLSSPYPRTPAAWRELPGVGPYTAAAITSIAFGEPAACVDGNVVRILARLTGDATLYRDSATAAKAFTPLADRLIPATSPGDHNQAMMELGATVCLRHNPSCLLCPVKMLCVAGRNGNPENYPRLEAKLMEKRSVLRVWCERKGSLLLHLAHRDSRRLANLHELPTAEQIGLPPFAAQRHPLLAKKKRGITRFQITESIHTAPSPRGKLLEGLVWIPLSKIDSISLSGPHRRWITEIVAQRGSKI